METSELGSCDEELRYMVNLGMGKRYAVVTPEIAKRADYELQIIAEKGLAAYFLILHDLCHWLRLQGIIVGPGRGGSPGALVAYALGITDVCPLKYGLLFERFVNPESESTAYFLLDVSHCLWPQSKRYGSAPFEFFELPELAALQEADTPVDENDPAVFDLFVRGDTDGLLLFSSPVFRTLLREIQPRCMADLCAVYAFRMKTGEEVAAFIAGKKNSGTAIGDWCNTTPACTEILSETYGVILYQEQVLRLISEISGFSLGHAELLRRTMAKGKKDALIHEKALFVAGGVAQGIAKEKGADLFDTLTIMANRTFIKANAIAYATLAYRLASQTLRHLDKG